MNSLTNLTTWLQGKKTYLICTVAILTALLAYLNHQLSIVEFAEAVLAALGGATIHSSVTTSTKKVIDATNAAAAVAAAGSLSNAADQPHDPNDLG